jgi:hypothetical protein
MSKGLLSDTNVEVDVVGFGGLAWIEVKACRGAITAREWNRPVGSSARSLRSQVWY